MSLLDKNLETFQSNSGYKFSAPSAASFGAAEYTLVNIVADTSGSVSGFAAELLKAVQTAVASCKKSPRAENLMIRTRFDSSVFEHHGFQFLNGIDPAVAYADMFNRLGGCTSLFDATFEAIEAAEAEGKRLNGLDIMANAIIFVITDGDDNASHHKAADIAALAERVRKAESLESINVVLIGITDGNTGLSAYLDNFKQAAKIDQYVDVNDTTAGKLAKLADFVSRSISSTSQALGTGPSLRAFLMRKSRPRFSVCAQIVGPDFA